MEEMMEEVMEVVVTNPQESSPSEAQQTLVDGLPLSQAFR